MFASAFSAGMEAVINIPSRRIDNPSGVRAIYSLVARTFLSMFGRLEREAVMSEMSEVRNLGMIMSLCLKWAHDVRADVDWDGELFVHQIKTSFRNDSVELTMADGTTTTYQFAAGNFDGIVLSYANKYAIPLAGPPDIDNISAEVETDDVELPPVGVKEDPFDLKKAHKSYVKKHGRCDGPRSKPVVGGDSFDITTMSPKERKECSFTGKDPLSKKELKMLKEGMVMQMA